MDPGMKAKTWTGSTLGKRGEHLKMIIVKTKRLTATFKRCDKSEETQWWETKRLVVKVQMDERLNILDAFKSNRPDRHWKLDFLVPRLTLTQQNEVFSINILFYIN